MNDLADTSKSAYKTQNSDAMPVPATSVKTEGLIMSDVDPVVERVREKLRLRSNTGIKKYGRTMDREDLDTVAWLRHAQDESLDLAIYLERLIANYRLESNDGR